MTCSPLLPPARFVLVVLVFVIVIATDRLRVAPTRMAFLDVRGISFDLGSPRYNLLLMLLIVVALERNDPPLPPPSADDEISHLNRNRRSAHDDIRLSYGAEIQR